MKIEDRLSSKTHELFDRYEQAALEWGCQESEGYGPAREETEAEYRAARAVLLRHLVNLEVGA